MKKPKVKMVADRVLIRRDKTAEVSAGGVLLPEGTMPKPCTGTVVAVGALKNNQMEVDDKVYFSPYAETIELDGEEFACVREDDVILVVL